MKAIGKGSLSSGLAILLSVGWYGVAVLLALAFCVVLVSPWVDPPRVEVGLAVPVAFSLDAEVHEVPAAPGFEDVHVHNLRGSLRFSPRSRGFVAMAALSLVVVLGLVLWAIDQLRAVFRSLREGQPFVTANAMRIRRIGWAVILGELARAAFAYWGSSYAAMRFVAEGIRFEARSDFDFLPIVYGLIILVIAEVFRVGTRLDEEQSLTV